MRPLLHPSLDDLRPDAILHALADRERAAIFADIARSECVERCSEVAEQRGRTVPKSSLSQHLKILREAGLVRSERVGAQLRNHSRCTEVEQRFPGLIKAILTAYEKEDSAAG